LRHVARFFSFRRFRFGQLVAHGGKRTALRDLASPRLHPIATHNRAKIEMNARGQDDVLPSAADTPHLVMPTGMGAGHTAAAMADLVAQWGALTASTGVILLDLEQLADAAGVWPTTQLQPLSLEQAYAMLGRLLEARERERGPGASARSSLSALTPRQCDILRETVRGKSNVEIAQTLHISVETVKSHVRQILMRLGARNRTELAALYQQSVSEIPPRERN
jgi:DNA-binding CsgD family transcriptional regulator